MHTLKAASSPACPERKNGPIEFMPDPLLVLLAISSPAVSSVVHGRAIKILQRFATLELRNCADTASVEYGEGLLRLSQRHGP